MLNKLSERYQTVTEVVNIIIWYIIFSVNVKQVVRKMSNSCRSSLL